jgi:hypothetical protein
MDIEALELNFVKGIKHWSSILPKVSRIGTKFGQRYQALKLNLAKDIKH